MRLGERQTLTVVKKVDFGVYLADTAGPDADPEEKVLVPGKEVPADIKTGDEMTVFVYRDSKDRLIATVRDPEFYVGEVAVLPVKDVGKFGAFLGWGLEKDLLLPFKEQTKRVQIGDTVVAAMYIDKSGRLCTTMKVYPYLRKDSPYHKDDKVEGRVYEINDRFGVFVAVDNRYSALIPKKEPAEGLRVGDVVHARVTSVLDDGKLSLSVREKAYIQMNSDADKIMEMIEAAGGRLDFNDKASPELIREKTGMSKNEFKRAVGNLYKQRLILIEEDGITKI
ncbi:MAG: S1 RNA-binding domain-containing protein [Lachnospiraceae bacterium]|nr:S1 RNA-binding domain-containing protein [Lachnospiraceae bacterium]